MKKICSLLILFSIFSFSQNKFLPGYYIDNSNNKIECLIKNYDWKNNPVSFETKKSETDAVKIISLSESKEFEITNISKYVRETLEIDTSSDNIQNISSVENPIFITKSIFLKVLIEGKNSLYRYEDANIPTRFFLKVDNEKIKQLVYKRYLDSNQSSIILKNEMFKKQLYSFVRCSSTKISEVEGLKYNDLSLFNYFNFINKCQGDTSLIKIEKVKKVKIFIKPLISFNKSVISLEFKNGNINGKYSLDNKFNLGFGAEIELVLPFFNNNWSVFIEPSYNTYSGKTLVNIPVFANPNYEINANYNYIQLPIGIKRNIIMNSYSKFFISGALNFRYGLNSKIEIQRESPVITNGLTLDYTFGVGYQYKKISAELRFYTASNINPFVNNDKFLFKNSSIIFKYQFN